MNPFDLKSALLAKHAQHVVLIHFPIALFLTGAAFDVAARLIGKPARKTALLEAARLNLWLAALSSIPTLITGILAWQLQFHGKRLKGILLLHLVLATTASSFMGLTVWLRERGRKESVPPAWILGLELVTVALIGTTAHVGGFLSGVNIPG